MSNDATNSVTANISFYNDTLTAIKDPAGDIWVVMNQILRNIGFDDKKISNQRTAWSKDVVLNRGSKILEAPINGYQREVNCLNRRYIPLALAKISITPTMQRTQPEVVEKLIRYQEECADVLYKYFYPREISKDTSLPLSREEMAMYMAALQSQTDEVKKMCVETFNGIAKVIQKYEDNNSKCLSLITDTASKFYSAYSLNTDKIISCLSNMNTVKSAQPAVTEDSFMSIARDLLNKICKAYGVELKTAYTLIYGKMVEVDGINPYKYKTESSVIKSIAKNVECRESFEKCVAILLEDKKPQIKSINNTKSYLINTSDNRTANPFWQTPTEVQELINKYKDSHRLNSDKYTYKTMMKSFYAKSGLSASEIRKLATEYGKSKGSRCSVAYYLTTDRNLFQLLKTIAEEN